MNDPVCSSCLAWGWGMGNGTGLSCSLLLCAPQVLRLSRVLGTLTTGDVAGAGQAAAAADVAGSDAGGAARPSPEAGDPWALPPTSHFNEKLWWQQSMAQCGLGGWEHCMDLTGWREAPLATTSKKILDFQFEGGEDQKLTSQEELGQLEFSAMKMRQAIVLEERRFRKHWVRVFKRVRGIALDWQEEWMASNFEKLRGLHIGVASGWGK